jgi:hypothetical protein
MPFRTEIVHSCRRRRSFRGGRGRSREVNTEPAKLQFLKLDDLVVRDLATMQAPEGG